MKRTVHTLLLSLSLSLAFATSGTSTPRTPELFVEDDSTALTAHAIASAEAETPAQKNLAQKLRHFFYHTKAGALCWSALTALSAYDHHAQHPAKQIAGSTETLYHTVQYVLMKLNKGHGLIGDEANPRPTLAFAVGTIATLSALRTLYNLSRSPKPLSTSTQPTLPLTITAEQCEYIVPAVIGTTPLLDGDTRKLAAPAESTLAAALTQSFSTKTSVALFGRDEDTGYAYTHGSLCEVLSCKAEADGSVTATIRGIRTCTLIALAQETANALVPTARVRAALTKVALPTPAAVRRGVEALETSARAALTANGLASTPEIDATIKGFKRFRSRTELVNALTSLCALSGREVQMLFELTSFDELIGYAHVMLSQLAVHVAGTDGKIALLAPYLTGADVLAASRSRRLSSEARNELLKAIAPFAPAAQLPLAIRKRCAALINLPWGRTVEEQTDFAAIAETVDHGFLFREREKTKLLNYVAQVLNQPAESETPLLLLSGAEGMGRKTIARTLAAALNRPCIECTNSQYNTLKGGADEPSLLIQGLIKAQCDNPVIVIDRDVSKDVTELEKLLRTRIIEDSYLAAPYDLSRALFVIISEEQKYTYVKNSEDTFYIHLNDYSYFEKVALGQQVLVPQAARIAGLATSEFTVPVETIRAIIERRIPAAPGVSNLQCLITTLARAAAKHKAQYGTLPAITPDTFEILLGVTPVSYYTNQFYNPLTKDTVGAANGLLVTRAHGAVHKMLTARFQGTGKLIMTSQPTKLTRHSMRGALSFVQAHASEFEIDPAEFTKTDVHAHIFDSCHGPSAGIAFTVALVSLFTNRPVKASIAATGGIDIFGNATGIGGVQQKLTAAIQAGLTDVIFPKANEADVRALTGIPFDAINIHFVETVYEALDLMLAPAPAQVPA